MIVHTGEALIDFIPVKDSDGRRAFHPAPGGSPYNTSIAVSRLDVPNAFLGRISRDFFGDQLIDYLKDNSVRTDMIVRDNALSTLAFVGKSETGEVRYAFFANEAADRRFSPEDIPVFPPGTQALQFGSISLIANPVGETILSLIERESARGRVVLSFDPNIRESLIEDASIYRKRIERAVAAATIVKVSDEDLKWIHGTDNLADAAHALLEHGPLLVVVTEGARGSTAYTAQGLIAGAEAEKTVVSDTVGAGDSFHAAVLAWLYHSGVLTRAGIRALQRGDLDKMLRFAGAVAAKTCSRSGADPPRLAEVAAQFRTGEVV